MFRVGVWLAVLGPSLAAAQAVAAQTEPIPVPALRAVTLALSADEAVWGDRVTASGAVTGVEPGALVSLERLDGATWLPLGAVAVDEAGAYSFPFVPQSGGPLRARIDPDVVSAEAALTLSPRATVRAKPGVAYVGARMTVRVRPLSYAGRIVVSVRRRGAEVGRVAARAVNGRAVVTAPTPGIGAFRAVVELRPSDGLAAASAAAPLRATARTLAAGAEGADVRALTRRLTGLRFRLPGPVATYDYRVADAVIAFQKARASAHRRRRARVWRRLERAEIPQPRHRRPADHLEVDKTRQILIVVRDGQTAAVLPASTGATGNTPEGAWSVRWKALATTTWLGPAILYRTMTFIGNEFAIHGFPSVPVYPASHGCVRIPLWTADWLYDRTPVGQRVFVYR